MVSLMVDSAPKEERRDRYSPHSSTSPPLRGRPVVRYDGEQFDQPFGFIDGTLRVAARLFQEVVAGHRELENAFRPARARGRTSAQATSGRTCAGGLRRPSTDPRCPRRQLTVGAFEAFRDPSVWIGPVDCFLGSAA